MTLKDCRFVPSTVWNVQALDSYIRDCTNRSSRATSSLAFKTCLQPQIIPTYVREEELVRQFGEILKQVRIPAELAGKLATVLRESQADKQKFVRTPMLRLQQQQMLLRSKLNRVYEDRLSDAIPDEVWT